MKRAGKKKIEMITRLIRYFNPEKLLIPENEPFPGQVIKTCFPDIQVVDFNHPAKPALCREFIISSDPLVPVEELSDNFVWILPDLTLPQCRDLFLTLQKDPKVKITIEVNLSGIVISNQHYQKQDYFINPYFFF